MMKIALPVADGKLCMHFGHCEKFAIFDISVDNNEIKSTAYMEPPPHEPGLLPEWLSQKGVTCVIAGGMGSRAQEIFRSKNVSVIAGAPPEPPEEVVMKFLDNRLEVGANVCDH